MLHVFRVIIRSSISITNDPQIQNDNLRVILNNLLVDIL